MRGRRRAHPPHPTSPPSGGEEPGWLTYHPTAQSLHWITAIAVIGMLGLGLWMTDLPLGFTKLYAYNWHKSVGLAVLVLTVGRLLWRWRHPPPPLPGTVVGWQAALAPVAHWMLLLLLLAMPITAMAVIQCSDWAVG